MDGSFTNLQLQMPFGWTGALASNANQIVLNVLSVVATTPPQLGLAVSNGLLQIGWPSDHTGWRLLMNTNLAGTNWLDVPGADAASRLLISPTNGRLFFRLVYP